MVDEVAGKSMRRVLMTLDGVAHDPETPLLHADDAAVLRGDGVFETVLVRGGLARKLPAHLARLAASAQIMDLPAPDLDEWGVAATAAAKAWGGIEEGVLRLVLSRGRESAPGPTAFLSVSAVPARIRRVRESGLSAMTLERGYSVDVPASSPWLPLGAKTLSYAVNMAAVRHAESAGADDVVFLSAEGNVLEGPRSTVLIARGRTLITPPPEQGILAGTTQRALFQEAERRGLSCSYAPLRPADLFHADGVWLLSSIALAARVHTLNGVRLRDSAMEEEIASMVASAI